MSRGFVRERRGEREFALGLEQRQVRREVST
jgi:hypothetical protein